MADRNISARRPPVDGSLFLPGVIDFNLEHNYYHSFFVWANEEPSDGIEVITQGEFARACHRVAHIVRPPGMGTDQEVVAILGNVDTILYIALVGGIIRAGMVPFTMSPRNSPGATLSMLRSVGCHRVLVSRHSVSDLTTGIDQELIRDPYNVSFEDIPLLATIYPKLAQETPEDHFEPYLISETPPILDDICLYLHSSGSTSNPRAIAQSHRIVLHWQHFPLFTEAIEHDPPLRFASYILPPFHIAGLVSQLIHPLILTYGISVLPPTSYKNLKAAPMTPTNAAFLSYARRSKANAITVVPSFLENWMEDQSSFEWLKSLELVASVGAALSRKMGGDLVAAGITLTTPYGATEIGGPVHMFPRKQDLLDGDWDWFRFSERTTPRWIPQGDGLFELQILTTDTHQVGIENLEDVRGYATKDLFEKHPKKPDLFRVRGRIDDVIVLSTGEKAVPGHMEDYICHSPEVNSAVIFGTGRPQMGILVDPRPGRVVIPLDKITVKEYKEEIWPFIEKANSMGPSFARIFKEMVIITEPSKPLPRSAKGNVVKKLALNLYTKEIDEAYNNLRPSTSLHTTHSITFPKNWHGNDLLEWVIDEASHVHNGKVFNAELDIFSQGFDSLGVLFLHNRIVAAMRASVRDSVRTTSAKIPQDFIYDFPTLSKISEALSNQINSHAGVVSELSAEQDKGVAIEDQITKYTEGIGIRNSFGPYFVPEDVVVLLTGSTGSIGSFLLSDLLGSGTLVRKVYALNRSSGNAASQSRQRSSFVERGLDVSLLESRRCQFIEGDISQENLGLANDVYEELLGSVTAIVHNGWRVDFNLPMSSFELNLKSIRALIDFANAANHNPRIIFSSSVSAKLGQHLNKEQKSHLGSVIGSIGYGESKYVAERMLSLSGINACSLRIGQVSGSTSNGAWPTTNWIPMIIKSSIRLGCLPVVDQYVDWIPVDKVSKIILEVLFRKETLPLIMEVVHPKPISWPLMIEAVNDALEKKKVCRKLPLIPWGEWIAKIEEFGSSQLNDDLLQSLPALKILKFLRQFDGNKAEVGNDVGATDSTDTADKFSKTLEDISHLSPTDIGLWVQFWHSTGFL